jgi:hypothetical protein
MPTLASIPSEPRTVSAVVRLSLERAHPYDRHVPAIAAIFGGLLFSGAGVAVLDDFPGTGTRMAEQGSTWAGMGSVDQHRRKLGAGYLVLGLVLLAAGVGMLASWM